MRTILRIIIVSIVLFITFYKVEQDRQNELSKIVEDIHFVMPEKLNYLSIIQYPEERTYSSFHSEEVQQMLHTFNKLELKETKRLSTSENYTKIILLEDGWHQFIEYNLYDNGFIKYVEEGLVGGRSLTYKMEEEKLKEVLASLLAGKILE